MLSTLHAERVTIDETEDGFLLTIVTEEIGTVRVNIQDVAVALETEVRRELRPYVLEAEHVAGQFSEAFVDLASVDVDAGYELDDPKSPAYVAAMEWKADQVRHLLRGDA